MQLVPRSTCLQRFQWHAGKLALRKKEGKEDWEEGGIKEEEGGREERREGGRKNRKWQIRKHQEPISSPRKTTVLASLSKYNYFRNARVY